MSISQKSNMDSQPVINVNVTSPAQSRYTTHTSDKSKKTALLLCIFLGMIGVHLFYVGRIGRGILYFCTGGLFAIGWIVDIFKIAVGSFRDNVGAPLRE